MLRQHMPKISQIFCAFYQNDTTCVTTGSNRLLQNGTQEEKEKQLRG